MDLRHECKSQAQPQKKGVDMLAKEHPLVEIGGCKTEW